MRGKAWLRTSPYVALPFDSDRVRPELVGLLCFIPSRAARRGEDLFTLRIAVPRVVLQVCGAKPLAQSRIQSREHLADVPQITETGRNGGPNNKQNNRQNCTRFKVFTQGYSAVARRLNCLFSTPYTRCGNMDRARIGFSESRMRGQIRGEICDGNLPVRYR
jgi:hypothetical protein